MSTRSQFAIYEKEDSPVSAAKVFLYRHSNGYPESVLPEIKPFLLEFNKVRGIGDTAYCLARLAMALMTIQASRQKQCCIRHLDEAFLKECSFLGYGVMAELAGGIEYFYHISPTAIKVYHVGSANIAKWKLMKRVELPAGRDMEGF